jgi:NTE family protein
MDGQYYVDGGLLNPVPVNRVKRNEGDLLVVVNVSSPIPYEKRRDENEHPPEKHHIKQINLIQRKFNSIIPSRKDEDIGIFNLTNRSIGTMMRRIADLTLEMHHPDLSIDISKESFSMYDFYKAKEIIKEGELAAQKALSRFQTAKYQLLQGN